MRVSICIDTFRTTGAGRPTADTHAQAHSAKMMMGVRVLSTMPPVTRSEPQGTLRIRFSRVLQGSTGFYEVRSRFYRVRRAVGSMKPPTFGRDATPRSIVLRRRGQSLALQR